MAEYMMANGSVALNETTGDVTGTGIAKLVFDAIQANEQPVLDASLAPSAPSPRLGDPGFTPVQRTREQILAAAVLEEKKRWVRLANEIVQNLFGVGQRITQAAAGVQPLLAYTPPLQSETLGLLYVTGRSATLSYAHVGLLHVRRGAVPAAVPLVLLTPFSTSGLGGGSTTGITVAVAAAADGRAQISVNSPTLLPMTWTANFVPTHVAITT